MISALLLAFVAGAVATLVLSPVAIFVARRFGVVDAPGPRKIHARPVPLLGGAAVLAATVGGVAIASGRVDPALAIAGLLVFATGLADDLRKGTISPWARLAFEAVAAAIAVGLGGCRAGVLPVPVLDACLTGAFLVLSANALNLSDNMNGLAAGIGCTAAGSLAIVVASADPGRAVFLGAIAGAAAGFLPFNWPSARIFLGDAGALSIGFLVPASVFASAGGERTWARFGAVVVALGLPLVDTALVSVSRWRRGVPVFEGDRRHLSHRWAALGLGPARAVAALLAFSLLLAVDAVALDLGSFGAVVGAVAAIAVVLAGASRAPRGLDGEA